MATPSSTLGSQIQDLLPELERIYIDIHAHPELSMHRIREAKPTSASEDFGAFGTAWQTPSVFWFVGGTDPEKYAQAKQAGRIREIPTNHNPAFAPVLHPTLETGVAAIVVASHAWLAT